MKRKAIVFMFILLLLGQTGFADLATFPPNIELTEKQEIFYTGSGKEIDGYSIRGIMYYPKEKAVYLNMAADNVKAISMDRMSNSRPELAKTVAVTKAGFVSSAASAFYREGFVYDFEVDQGEGFLLAEGQGPYLLDAAGNGVSIFGIGENRGDFEVFGDQFAWIGDSGFRDRAPVLQTEMPLYQNEYQFATLPEVFDVPFVEVDRVMSFGFVEPVVFDFSADGSEIVAVGYEKQNDVQRLSEPSIDELYIEILPILTQSLAPRDFLQVSERQVEEVFRFPVKVEGYGDASQNILIGDMYTTEEHIVVIICEWNKKRVFLQRYSYDGKLVDQIETSFSANCISPGPNGSTLYLQKQYMELEEPNRDELNFLERKLIQFEIIQMNWDQEDQQSGGMRPVIAERTFGGQTLARFTDKKFGLLKQVEEETGIVDYRAPLKAQTNDLRLQIPYCDLLAKAGTGARNLMITYQGQEIAISFDLLLSVGVDEMPCQDDATIEIHLQVGEEGNISYTIELFVVEQVDAMTKLVHRKTIQ
jgi:hypothetical protein